MKWFKKNITSSILLCTLITVFYSFLFFPSIQAIITPDFGKSDSWHQSYPSKQHLSTSLLNRQLPLWDPLLGNGNPSYAEGLQGSWYLPNLVFFSFIPFKYAYTFVLLFHMYLFGIGVYYWLTNLRFHKYACFTSALAASMSGIIVPNFVHIPALFGLCLFPWVFTATNKFIQYKNMYSVSFLAFLFGQLILIGFPQTVLIALIWCLITIFWYEKKHLLSTIVYFSCTVLLGIGIGSIQLLPTLEYTKELGQSGHFSQNEATYFSFPIKHLLTFIDPYMLGNPQNGSYPHFILFDGSVFWENSGYLGIPILLGSLFGIIYALITRKKEMLYGVIVLIVSFLLMTGKYSPLYFVYSIFPFSFFRVPSRFVWLFTLAIAYLAAGGLSVFLSYIRSKTLQIILTIIICVCSFVQLKNAWQNYNLITPFDAAFTKPESLSYISQDETIYSIGAEIKHNTLYKKGYKNPEDYLLLHTMLDPNQSRIWQIKSASVYTARELYRRSILDSLISIDLSKKSQTASVRALAEKALTLKGVSTIISSQQLKFQEPDIFPQSYTLNSDTYIYKRPIYPLVYTPDKILFATTKEQTITQLENNDASKIALVEDISLTTIPPHNYTVNVKEISPTNYEFTIKKQDTESIIVIRNTFYPGWIALSNNLPLQIFPVNIAFSGIVVPPNTDKIQYQFISKSLYSGAAITIFSLVILTGLVAVQTFSSFQKFSLKR